jgi:hypothetical protein
VVAEQYLSPDHLAEMLEALTYHLNYDADYLKDKDEDVSTHCRKLAQITETVGNNIRKKHPKREYEGEGSFGCQPFCGCPECHRLHSLIPLGRKSVWGVCHKHKTRWESGGDLSMWKGSTQAELDIHWLLYTCYRNVSSSVTFYDDEYEEEQRRKSSVA